MITFLLSLLPDFLKVYLGIKVNSAEALGKAEERADVADSNAVALKREAAVDANLPQDKTAMEKLMAEDKL